MSFCFNYGGFNETDHHSAENNDFGFRINVFYANRRCRRDIEYYTGEQTCG